MHRVHHLRPPGDAGEGEATAERLPGHDEIRLDPVMLDRPDGAGATYAGLHLVVDIEDAVRRKQLLQPTGEVEGHWNEATLSLHGLEHRAGNRFGIDIAPEEVFERLERSLG